MGHVFQAVDGVFQFFNRPVILAAQNQVFECFDCGTSASQLFAVHGDTSVGTAKLFPVRYLSGEYLLEVRARKARYRIAGIDENAHHVIADHLRATDLRLFSRGQFASDATEAGASFDRSFEAGIRTCSADRAEGYARLCRKQPGGIGNNIVSDRGCALI